MTANQALGSNPFGLDGGLPNPYGCAAFGRRPALPGLPDSFVWSALGERQDRPPSLHDLTTRLRRAQAARRRHERRARPRRPASALGIAFEVAAEVVSALAVGVGIGWLLDDWLSTGPLFLVVFFFLGAAAGGLNVYRRARQLVTREDDEDGGGSASA